MVKKETILLILILAAGLFLRIYKFQSFYIFEHDQDLFSWIVRDIVVNHHFRLIGQLTSIDGLFVGPLFYYLLAPFFILFNMNPLGALVPAVILGVFTSYSFYYVFSSFFGKKVGLIAAFIYAVSLGSVFYDRWVVPTQPTILWSVWFMYVLFSLLRGNLKVLPILGLLIGLIWHIHIALAPLIVVIPFTLILALKSDKQAFKKIPPWSLFLSALFLVILIIPFWLFELKYGFQQINGLLASFTDGRGELSGLPRFVEILQSIVRFFRGMLWIDNRFIAPNVAIFVIFSLFLTGFCLKAKKIISMGQVTSITLWVLIVILSQQFSKRPVSEYYFLSLLVPFMLVVSLVLVAISRVFNRQFIYLATVIFFVWNLVQLVKMPEPQNSFVQKREVAAYIKEDMELHDYPCAGVNYIANFGTGVGFRYLMEEAGVQIINPVKGAPIYNIVIPWTRSENEIDAKFGDLGVIKPKSQEFRNQALCGDPANQLLPLLGFSN